jgi:RNA polymerase sigma factor (sigma-70 family)
MALTNSSNTSNDGQLWEQLKQGSELALGKLIKIYFNLLLNYGYKFVKDEAFVKDCVQDVFISIWTHRDTILTPSSIHAYLLSSVRRRIFREKVRQRIEDNPSLSNIENEPELLDFSPEWLLIEKESLNEMAQKVSELLNKLPKRQREVLYLRFYQNLERTEIGDIMGINDQSVSNHLQAAFKNFKENWHILIILISLALKIYL